MKPIIPLRALRRGSLHIQSLLTLFVVVLLGCPVNPTFANAITPQVIDHNIPGKIAWRDLFTHDLASTSRFYEELFGWSFVNSLSGNTKVKRIFLGENHIGNAIEIEPLTKKLSESQWLNYMSVENVDDAVKRIEDNKGLIQIPARDLPQRGRIAVCLDAQKAVFAIIKPRQEEPDAQQTELNSWLGSELWTNDIDGALKFYGNLVGYNMQIMTMGNGETYKMLMSSGKARAGIVKIPFDDVEPNWVPYIAVKDTMAVTEKVLQLGGQLLTEPDRDLSENDAVIIADPSGAVFGIQQVVLVGSDEGDRK
jgi:uncharacterized protein